MIKEQIDLFFSTAIERYRIKVRRDMHARGTLASVCPEFSPGRWTNDKVFQTWRFCNTFREDDKTTVWFRQNIRGLLQRRMDDVLFATIAFRWFNRIETAEKILDDLVGGPANWDSARVREKLKDASPVVTGAYIIKTPNGMNKLDGVLWCIDQIKDACDSSKGHGFTYGALANGIEELKMEDLWRTLTEYPYLGDFMAYQIVSDLRHTVWLKDAPDAYTWASPGPGSTRGLGWLEAGDPDRFKRTNKQDWAKMISNMQELVFLSQRETNWPTSLHGWPQWEMQTVQHWLCEFDKYTRASKGQDQKRRFK